MLYDYIIYFRCFVGPGYWGSYKHTLAFDDDHAQRKLERVWNGFLAKHPQVRGEMRIERTSGQQLKIRLQGLRQRYNRTEPLRVSVVNT